MNSFSHSAVHFFNEYEPGVMPQDPLKETKLSPPRVEERNVGRY